LAFVFFLRTELPILAEAQSPDPPTDTDKRPDDKQQSDSAHLAPVAIGDELFRINLEATTGHAALLGVEYVDGYYYVTSGGMLDVLQDNYLFQLSDDGTLISSWLQPTEPEGWGWRDLAWDGAYLYGSDSDVIEQIDPTTGQPTGITITAPISPARALVYDPASDHFDPTTGQPTGITITAPISPARALAYDPASDHFWTANFDSDLYEIDRSGNVVNSYSNILGIYGLGWDASTEGGPYLWAWSQDGTPAVTATQIDPATGAPTGVSFLGSSVDGSDIAGGADIDTEVEEGKVVLIGMHQADDDTIVGYELSVLDVEPPWGRMDVCVPAEAAPFTYINQPWDWVEGAVTPGSQINATLTRGGNDIASTSSSADTSGWFSFDFQISGAHVDILAGDEVTLIGGGLNETIQVVDIQGWIDVPGDTVAGFAGGGTFDVWGVVCVRQPFDPWFESKEVYFDANGRFDVNFSGQADIDDDYIAQVVYPDQNGNYVVQVFYPEGLDLNVLISEDRIEGVTTPGSQVSVVVWDESGEKGTAVTTANEMGFYSTPVLVNGKKLNLELGDHVGVSNAGHAREIFLVLSHESWLQPWNKRVQGIVQGMGLPPAGTQGKVDLWSVVEKKWYSQYTWIENDGRYGVVFDDVPEMSATDRIRLWVSDGDGVQQATFGTTLDLGVSVGNSLVWGYTIADSPVTVTLFRGLNGDLPVDVLGVGGTRADASGFFSTTLTHNNSPIGVTPGNIVQFENNEFSKYYFVGKVDIIGDSENDILTISGPPNAILHLEGFRVEDTTTTSFVWAEATIGVDGQVEIDLDPHDLQDSDIFKIVTYLDEDGITIELMMAVYSGDLHIIFLPLVER